jgi:hypothetical protein
MLKMAVFAPMPSASDSTATAVNAGLLPSIRAANRKSFSSVIVLAPLAVNREP